MFPKVKRVVDRVAIEKVMARDPYCQVCGGIRQDVHHIRSRGSGGPDAEENMIGLCRTCHNRVHAGEIPRALLRAVLADKYGY